jgi:hypothetical protein
VNEVKNLDLLVGSKKRDPSAAPQDDFATQSLEEQGRVKLIDIDSKS